MKKVLLIIIYQSALDIFYKNHEKHDKIKPINNRKRGITKMEFKNPPPRGNKA